MSSSFNRFQSLPWELQVMVFEHFMLSTQQPRIALLGVEARQVQDEGAILPVWQLSLDNREQLHAGNPAVAAEGIMGLCSASRDVATRFLAGHGGTTIKPPRHEAALMGLGLSLASDAYWIPHNMVSLVDPLIYGTGIVEESDMESVMISLDTFEEPVQVASNPEGVVDVRTARLSILILEFFQFFYGIRNLIIMVDVPRRHISWNQIRIVGVEDPTLPGIDDEDLRARCLDVFQRYEAVHEKHHSRPWAYKSECTWPELSFAFVKP